MEDAVNKEKITKSTIAAIKSNTSTGTGKRAVAAARGKATSTARKRANAVRSNRIKNAFLLLRINHAIDAAIGQV